MRKLLLIAACTISVAALGSKKARSAKTRSTVMGALDAKDEKFVSLLQQNERLVTKITQLKRKIEKNKSKMREYWKDQTAQIDESTIKIAWSELRSKPHFYESASQYQYTHNQRKALKAMFRRKITKRQKDLLTLAKLAALDNWDLRFETNVVNPRYQ